MTYTEGQTGPTVLDSGFTFSDSDTLTSATVAVSGFEAGDTLLFGTVTGATLGAATTTTVGGDTVVTQTLASRTDADGDLRRDDGHVSLGDDGRHGRQRRLPGGLAWPWPSARHPVPTRRMTGRRARRRAR